MILGLILFLVGILGFVLFLLGFVLMPISVEIVLSAVAFTNNFLHVIFCFYTPRENIAIEVKYIIIFLPLLAWIFLLSVWQWNKS